jgi:hypothetical protein
MKLAHLYIVKKRYVLQKTERRNNILKCLIIRSKILYQHETCKSTTNIEAKNAEIEELLKEFIRLKNRILSC